MSIWIHPKAVKMKMVLIMSILLHKQNNILDSDADVLKDFNAAEQMNCSSETSEEENATQKYRFGTNRKYANMSEAQDMQEKENQKSQQ